MTYIPRVIQSKIEYYLAQDRSILVFGPRQTGKTTLLEQFDAAFKLSLIQPRIRQRYERDPSLLADEIEALGNHPSIPLVIIDEVQKIPQIMDVVQDLIDRKIAKFILTGSSARKLKHPLYINLLPGRVIVMHLDPFRLSEIEDIHGSIEELITNGSLPAIFLSPDLQEREDLLASYVTTYLEEEVRAEALVRNLSHFSRFLELAAIESGNIINYSKISQDIGIAHSTVAAYYQILEDCLIIERIEPLTKSKNRKKLTKSPKFLFFDMGVRRVAAQEGSKLPIEYMGRLFEQFIGLEIIRKLRTFPSSRILYWRDPDGPEVDWVIRHSNELIPIEVKWTDSPTLDDTKHLKIFLQEYQEAKNGYVICRTPRKLKLAENMIALPWEEITNLF